MSHRTAAEGYRALVLAPLGRDAEAVVGLLRQNGYQAQACPTLTEAAAALDEQAGVLLVTEEALAGEMAALVAAIERQPPWSDMPLLLLAARRQGRAGSAESVRRKLPAAVSNVVILERPLSSESLVSAIAAAMKSRQRQFEMRDRLAELDGQYRRLDTLLDRLPVGVAFVNADRSTLVANSAYRRFRPDGRIPSLADDTASAWEGYDEHGRRLTRDRFAAERALAGDEATPTEYLYHAPNGDRTWTRVSATPLRDGAGAVVGAVTVIVDIDAQKQAQQMLADAARRLEDEVAARTAELERALRRLQAETAERERAEASLRQSQKMEAVGQLTGGIAHDFNNMLTGVIGALDIMKRRIADGRLGDIDRFMDAAATSAQRAAGLTQRLLAFSRRQSLDTRPVDVNALVLSLEDLLRRTVHEAISVEFALGSGVLAALTDANQLENACLNLAINARDAMPDGGRLTITTRSVELEGNDLPGSATAPGRYIALSVADTGVGIAPEVLDKVYEPFFTTKPIGQGTGLGLSMVYGFAQQSGGTVRILSEVGRGTAVEILLPAADAVQPAVAAAVGPVPEGSGQTVLLVEDDASVRLLVQEVLEELGYLPVVAADPQAAIAVLQSDRPLQLMVSDVGLPQMNGRQLAEIARGHRPDLPILFVTGYAENAAIRSSFLGTNMAMIAKPFSLDDLAAKIGEMVR